MSKQNHNDPTATMVRIAGEKRKVQNLRPAPENETPLRPMRGEALEAQRSVGQETTGEKSKLSLTLKATERKQQARKR